MSIIRVTKMGIQATADIFRLEDLVMRYRCRRGITTAINRSIVSGTRTSIPVFLKCGVFQGSIHRRMPKLSVSSLYQSLMHMDGLLD